MLTHEHTHTHTHIGYKRFLRVKRQTLPPSEEKNPVKQKKKELGPRERVKMPGDS